MKLSNGNIISDEGKILFFSIDEFCRKFGKNDCCFICGKPENDEEFNDEHIIPRWVLKRYNLFNYKITLPNAKSFRYNKYTLRCCKECNSLLGKTVEDVVCSGITDNSDSSISFINANYRLVAIWITLIFIKTHFRDKYFSFDFKNSSVISDMYKWETLHHLHCVSRSIYTGVQLNNSVFGSMFVFPCIRTNDGAPFDYIDIYRTYTVCIKLGNICVIYVLNDSGIVKNIFKSKLKAIDGPLNPIQVRELFTRIAYQNTLIVNRPKYYTEVFENPNKLEINSIIEPIIQNNNIDDADFGSFFYEMIRGAFFNEESSEGKRQVELIKKGVWTYIYDDNGNFIKS